MLTEIRIDGLGVISTATAQFHAGLTCLTGETGAGKTMVVTSLHLLSGARADAGSLGRVAGRTVVGTPRASAAEVPAGAYERPRRRQPSASVRGARGRLRAAEAPAAVYERTGSA